MVLLYTLYTCYKCIHSVFATVCISVHTVCLLQYVTPHTAFSTSVCQCTHSTFSTSVSVSHHVSTGVCHYTVLSTSVCQCTHGVFSTGVCQCTHGVFSTSVCHSYLCRSIVVFAKLSLNTKEIYMISSACWSEYCDEWKNPTQTPVTTVVTGTLIPAMSASNEVPKHSWTCWTTVHLVIQWLACFPCKPLDIQIATQWRHPAICATVASTSCDANWPLHFTGCRMHQSALAMWQCPWCCFPQMKSV